MEIGSVPASWLDMPVWAWDAAQPTMWTRTETIFSNCNHLYCLPMIISISLGCFIKPSSPMHCTLSSYYSWPLCWFSCETAGKGAQAPMVPGDSMASPGIPLGMHSGLWVSRSSHSMMCESELGKKQARMLRLPFSHSSLFLITGGLPRIYQFPSNDLHFISQLHYTKTRNMKGLLL